MSELLFQYEKVNPTTWAYLSSLLMIGLYFKFSRFWSVRNLDLALLILLAPGLLLAFQGQESAQLTWVELQTARAQRLAELERLEAPSAQPPPGGASASPPGAANPGTENSGAENSGAADSGAARPTSAPPDPAPPEPAPLRAAPSDGAATPEAKPDSVSGVVRDDQVDDDEAAPGRESGTATSPSAAPPGTTAATLPGPEAPAEVAVNSPLDVADMAVNLAELSWQRSRSIAALGFVWLIGGGGVLLIRLLLDPTMARRPLLEPNLSTGGLIFIACSLFIFLMANVIASVPTDDDLQGPRGAAALLSRETLPKEENDLARHGPGYAVLNLLPSVPTMSLLQPPTDGRPAQAVYAVVAKVMAILAHFGVVLGIVTVGYRHFDNLKMGVGAATLYLMLPYTALMTGRVDHVLPAALLLWAVVCYRRPLLAGIFIGLSAGVVYYPVFLLPLWLSFYWQRGVWRFLIGVTATLGLMILSLVFVSSNLAEFQANVQKMFGLWFPVREGLGGIWGLGWDPVYRLPVLASFIAISGTLAIWPAQKNLGTLLSCSAAIMVATQFWHPHGGGLYIAWYLPLLLLTIFRPNLEDRVALTVLAEGWFVRRPRRAA
ncbi:MAG: hypothetical protein U0935_08125 [Pirellulales bacterium]